MIYDDRDLSSILVVDDTEKQRFLLDAVYEQPMALRDRKPGDFEALRKVDEYNKQVLEPAVINTITDDADIISRMFEQTPELEGKQAFTMLTDSRGQQKAYLQHSSLIKSEEDLISEIEEKLALNSIKSQVKQQRKEERQEKKQAEMAYDSYLDNKLDINKLRNL